MAELFLFFPDKEFKWHVLSIEAHGAFDASWQEA